MKIATLVYIIQNGQVLLAEKKKGEIGTGIVVGPGGKLDEGETLEACAVRETFEEWGITISEEDLAKTAVITFYVAGNPDFEVHVFLTSPFEGELKETADAYMPKWYPITRLPLEKIFDGDRHWLPEALQGKKFCAHVYYKERAKNFERIEFFPPDF